MTVTWVARLRTCCTSSWVSDGFLRNNFTIAVSRVSWTCEWEHSVQLMCFNFTVMIWSWGMAETNPSIQFSDGRTWVLSSWKPSRKLSSNSSALSILSAYSPTIQIIAARASGSSRESRFSHRVAMMLSYLRDGRTNAGQSRHWL